jgi:SAM-dependent methyltransferase
VIDVSLAKRFGDLSLFGSNARYIDFDMDLIGRQRENITLSRLVEDNQPVIVIEGIAGVGKTALVAHLCRQVDRNRKIRWASCDNKRYYFNLMALAKTLASDVDPNSAIRLRTAIARRVSTSEIIDATIDFLATQSMLLIFDNFHAVMDNDPDVDCLLKRLASNRTGSSLILTSRVRIYELLAIPQATRMELSGLSVEDTRVLLSRHDVPMRAEMARTIWQRAGGGNPLALTLFTGHAREMNPEKLAELTLNLPSTADDLSTWIAPIFDTLTLGGKRIMKIIAFAYEPMSRDGLHAIAAPLDVGEDLTDLISRFLITANAGCFEMHDAVRDYVTKKTTDSEQVDLARRFADYYQDHARTIFLDSLGPEESSHGTLYMKSFPDYFVATARHINLIDDLLERLADNGYHLVDGKRVLVLGSGAGTHDAGFAKHGLNVTNVEIQPEVADIGRSKAAALPVEIDYVVADMTRPLPEKMAERSMDAVFNLGTTFGFDSADDVNAGLFRNAEKFLSNGVPFVFHYGNRPYWKDSFVQRQIDITPLSNGSTRTLVRVANPEAKTVSTMINLQRADGTGGWFQHFMRFYGLDEILAMMTAASLRPIAIYGSRGDRVMNEPYNEKGSQSMVIIAISNSNENKA